MIDLDNLFDKKLELYLKDRIGKISPELLEQAIPELYREWKNSYNNELLMSPNEYISSIKSNGKIIDELIEIMESKSEIGDMLSEGLCDEKFVAKLIDLVKKYPNYATHLCTIISNTNSTSFDKELIELLTTENKYVKEIIVETLKEGHENVVDILLEKIAKVSCELQVYFIDILYNYKGRQEIYDWILKLFNTSEEISIYATYLGSYGNEAAIDVLIEYASSNTMSSYEFMDIRNAVEMLGGDMPAREYDVVR